ncbi:MAG TPA: hypothetical protein VN374_05190 [Desulfitobacteriaceae bacterium]|nr:hypothetical protein [Desulfitobacteriaceae bacterium]
MSLRKANIARKVVYEGSDCALYKFAVCRPIMRETEDFTEEQIPNWPSFYVFVWNDPEKQYIAVQVKKSAFGDTLVVAKVLINAVNVSLHDRLLRAHIEELFDHYEFWDVADKNAGNIRDVRFEIVTPNMSNISAVLDDEYKSFVASTNTVSTIVDIKADEDSSIIVDKDNPRLSALVSYASEGGGKVSLGIKGYHKRVYMKGAKVQLDIDEMTFESGDPKSVSDILKDMFDGTGI